MNARTQPEWSEKLTVGSSEAAHLFRRLRARTLKMLSVKRGRAGRLDVGARASSLTLDLHAVGLTPAHSHGYGACAGVSPAFWRGRPRAPARVPAQSPLARRCNRIAHPPTQASAAWRRWSAMPPTRQHLIPVPMSSSGKVRCSTAPPKSHEVGGPGFGYAVDRLSQSSVQHNK